MLAGLAVVALVPLGLVLGLLSSLIVPDVVRRLVVPNGSKAKFDIMAIDEAVVSYAIDHGGLFPGSLDELLSPTRPLPDHDLDRLSLDPTRMRRTGHVPYLDLETLPLDPWGRPYGYELPEAGARRPRVFSLGAVGLPGGDGEDRDIDNLLIEDGKI